jgi:hypothetical protein
MKPSSGIGLGRPVQRELQGTHLPSPPVMLSGRLDRYYGHLRRPSGWLPLPGSSPVIGHRAPAVLRSPLGRGGPLQFPPSLSEHSAPSTPESPSRLLFQALHRFHGLRPSFRGSALSRPTRHRMSRVTTRQASLNAADRSVARHFRRLTLGFDPPVTFTRHDDQRLQFRKGSYFPERQLPDRRHISTPIRRNQPDNSIDLVVLVGDRRPGDRFAPGPIRRIATIHVPGAAIE